MRISIPTAECAGDTGARKSVAASSGSASAESTVCMAKALRPPRERAILDLIFKSLSVEAEVSLTYRFRASLADDRNRQVVRSTVPADLGWNNVGVALPLTARVKRARCA